MTLVAPTAVPGFELFECIGEGGMGAVYRARQLTLNRSAAVKLVHADRCDEKELIRFLAEAEAAAAVRHPHIVPVYEYGEHDGRPFLAMEHLPGGTLADKLHRGPLDPQTAAALFVKLARGVQAAHEQGIVHRDLKPANVLFAADGEPKIADFGLAKRMAGDLTRTYAVMGTPAYMAPEQARGEAKFVGPTADVWALGVMLYESLAGRRPFEADDPVALASRICLVPPTPLREAKSKLPRDLELIILKCLEKLPRDRYETAAALAEDLERYLQHRPVKARPAGLGKRLERWTRRNPGEATLAALLILFLVCGAVVSTIAASRFKDRADEAVAAKRDGDRQLFAALLSDADATRRSGQPGQRFATLEKLRQAMAMQDRVDLTEADIRNGRAIATAALCLPDLYEGPEFALDAPPADLPEPFRAELSAFAAAHAVGKELACVPSADGRYAVLRQSPYVVHTDNPVALWRLKPTPAPVVADSLWLYENAAAFSPDNTHVAVGRQDGTVRIIRCTDGVTTAEFRPGASSLWKVEWHPDSRHLAVITRGEIVICDVPKQTVVGRVPVICSDGSATFHPDGTFLAVAAAGGEISLWSFPDLKRIRSWFAFRAGGQRLSWDGEHILGTDWNGTLRLWDSTTGRELIRAVNTISNLRLTHGGAGLAVRGNRAAFVRAAPGLERVPLAPSTTGHLAPHPDGRHIAHTTTSELLIVDTCSRAVTARMPIADMRGNVQFDLAGSLYTFSAGNQGGIYRWPAVEGTFGPPHKLIPVSNHGFAFRVSPGGSVISPSVGAGALVYHPKPDRYVPTPAQFDVREGWLSPDARWAITRSYHHTADRTKLQIVDAQNGRSYGHLGLDDASIASGFSADSRWLYTYAGSPIAYHRWDLDHLRATGEFRREPDQPRLHNATSPNERSIALAPDRGSIAIVSTDGHERLRLPWSDSSGYRRWEWSADGARFFIAGSDDPSLVMYDLARIRTGLAEVGLDWPDPPFPTLAAVPLKPLRQFRGFEPYDPRIAVFSRDLLGYFDAFLAQPHDALGFVKRGLARASFGWHEGAEADYRTALAHDAACAEAWQEWACELFRQLCWPEAYAAFDMALALRPDAFAFERRGWLRAERGDAAGAAADYSAAAVLSATDDQVALRYLAGQDPASPNLAQALNNHAWRLVIASPARRMPKLALRLAEQAVERNPNDPQKWNTMGLVLYRNGRAADAIPWLKRSLAQCEARYAPWDHVVLALCLAKTDPAAAEHHYGLSLPTIGGLDAKESEEIEMLRTEAAANLKR